MAETVRNNELDIDWDYFKRPTRENGSAVLKTAPQRVERPSKSHIRTFVPDKDVEAKVKPRVGRGIDFISMVFLATAIVATLYICITYLQLQADIVQLDKQIGALEATLDDAARENEAFELSLDATAPDLEYIYNTAVGSLGMVYPNNNEVIFYSSGDEGYYRQYGDIPSK